MEWIKISDQEPPKDTCVLVYAYVGYNYDLKRAIKRELKIYIAQFCKPFSYEFEWRIDCDCSGYEVDRQFIEPIYWMPLPKEPKI